MMKLSACLLLLTLLATLTAAAPAKMDQYAPKKDDQAADDIAAELKQIELIPAYPEEKTKGLQELLDDGPEMSNDPAALAKRLNLNLTQIMPGPDKLDEMTSGGLWMQEEFRRRPEEIKKDQLAINMKSDDEESVQIKKENPKKKTEASPEQPNPVFKTAGKSDGSKKVAVVGSGDGKASKAKAVANASGTNKNSSAVKTANAKQKVQPKKKVNNKGRKQEKPKTNAGTAPKSSG
ncbi:uncharacterized protein LOC135937266 [Cloeon dipterum]|uniref:uncharacterized protein LOC135937266 n=1 Tax=Cloeon dipterum TaxID=197152 RepID=UPI0032201E97